MGDRAGSAPLGGGDEAAPRPRGCFSARPQPGSAAAGHPSGRAAARLASRVALRPCADVTGRRETQLRGAAGSAPWPRARGCRGSPSQSSLWAEETEERRGACVWRGAVRWGAAPRRCDRGGGRSRAASLCPFFHFLRLRCKPSGCGRAANAPLLGRTKCPRPG